jgi:hypothetical protein
VTPDEILQRWGAWKLSERFGEPFDPARVTVQHERGMGTEYTPESDTLEIRGFTAEGKVRYVNNWDFADVLREVILYSNNLEGPPA